MVEEVVELFKGSSNVLDCTLGGGGHTEALLVAGASVVAIDRDEAAITEARKRLASYETSGRFRALRGNFGEIDNSPELEELASTGFWPTSVCLPTRSTPMTEAFLFGRA